MHFFVHWLLHIVSRALGRRGADALLKPWLGFIDGSDEPAEERPLYSIAEAERKRGHYLQAREIVRAQLDRFPTDFQGQMLLAEIEAQDFKDLAAAEIVVQTFISQRGQSPSHIVYALSTMADWHLKYAQDREAARGCFQRIIDLFPNTESELRAAERIAHLGNLDLLLGTEARRTIHVPHIEGDPGLDGGRSISKPVEESGDELAAKYVKHLEEYPHDTEIREKLAQLYGEHFKRLDLAVNQLEQLIQYPNQPQRQVARWLNMQADFQVKFGGAFDAARAALQRIIDLQPDSGAANLARNRIELLGREFRGKEKSQTVTLGSYEDDLGLKGRLPHQL